MTNKNEETFKAHVSWLATTFLYKKQEDNALTVHYPDETPFCKCPILEEHCPDENYVEEKGPCPFYTIKCDKHVNKYGLQANPIYLKHHYVEPKKYLACAFCQLDKHGIDDVVMDFIKRPYIDNPDVNFEWVLLSKGLLKRE